jgi:hypothetical protein
MTIQEILDQRTTIDMALAPFDVKCKVRATLSFANVPILNWGLYPNTIQDFKGIADYYKLNHPNNQELPISEVIEKLQTVDINNWIGDNPKQLSETVGKGIVKVSTGEEITIRVTLSFYPI